MNLWPETLTNPVLVGAPDVVVVLDVILDVVVVVALEVVVDVTVDVALEVVVVVDDPGRHWLQRKVNYYR